MTEFCISGEELRKALREIEKAEKNGFYHCLAVFELSSVGYMLSDCRLTFSDLWERAHPSDLTLDWGRCQGITRRYKFKDGKLVPIKKMQNREDENEKDCD